MPHRSAFVCLSCRVSFKRSGHGTSPCPNCRRQLLLAGDAFAAPPRRDRDAWRVVAVLLRAGVDFKQDCCGCGPGYRPRSLREVRRRLTYARRTGTPVASALVA